MAPLKLEKFGGMLPSWDNLILPEGQAALSINSYLFSGTLVGWRQPKLLKALLNTTKFAYRIPNKNTNNTAITAADSFWMEFTDADTAVMRTPVVQDSFQRYYWMSPTDVPRYNTYDRIIAGDHSWKLGIPASGCSPGVVVTGGGDASAKGFNTIVSDGGNALILGNQVILIPLILDGTLLLQDVAFISQTTDSTLGYMGVIYTDLNGEPGQLIASTPAFTGVTAGTTATAVFDNAPAVQPNTQYWIGIAVDTAIIIEIADDRTNTGKVFDNTFANGPSDPAPATGSGPNWQMWGDFIGSSVFSARAYVYTYVSEYGEEGPPSAATLTNGWSNATWTISVFAPQPADMGGADRNITRTRIYRTISANTGSTSYFLVAEIPVEQETYVDELPDNEVAFNNQLVSYFWFGPPVDLQGLAAFPNGIAVGFRSNEVWFSEPYRPHAWPPGYVLTTEFPIVGVGICGQSVVVCTEGTPYLITGVNPQTMSLTKIKLHEPCLFRGSIVSTDTTVIYASQNGLIQVSQSGNAGNITEQWITRERWKALTPQSNVRAIKHATSYFAFGTVVGDDTSVAQQGFTVEMSQQDQTSFTVWPQAGGHRLGFNQLTSPNEFDIDNVQTDDWTGVGMLLQNSGMYYYDFTDQAPVIVPCTWRSKIYQQQTKKNYSAVRAFFTIPPGTPAQGVIDEADPQPTLAANQYGIMRVYADGDLYCTREIRKSGALLRIYSSTKVEQWQFEFETRVNITNVQIGTSVRELGLV
jgi:hypothetical protein